MLALKPGDKIIVVNGNLWTHNAVKSVSDHRKNGYGTIFVYTIDGFGYAHNDIEKYNDDR